MLLMKLPKRFREKIFEQQNGCWLWTACRTGHYGWVMFRSKGFVAHRAVYILLKGEIEKGIELHHKIPEGVCTSKLCVNPDHVEKTARRDHIDSMPSVNRRKTHCPNGHEYTQDNTRLQKLKTGTIVRSCKRCTYIRNKHHYVYNPMTGH